MIKFDINLLKKKIKKIRIGKLFYNNKFVAIFSVAASFITWVAVSSNGTESVPVIISDIPVSIQLSESAVQDGLRIFSGQDITARVEITGNRLIVGQVTKNDLQVTAPQAASTIMSPGNYTLELSTKKVGFLQGYEIVSDVKPSVITVMVDRYREAEFTVEPEIDFTPKADYFVGNTILSSPKVILSGPETEISKIKKVKIKSNVPGEVSSPITLKLPIIMYDVYDQPITNETISSSAYEIEASIPVLMKKEINIISNFSNLPEGINLKKEYKDMIKVNPAKLEIAGPEDIISNLKSVKLDAVDFNGVNIQNNKFDLPINLPQGCRSLNNVYSAEVSLNMAQFREKSFTINQFSFKNVPQNKVANVYNGNLNVTVLAPLSEIGSVRVSDLTAEVDFEGKSEFTSSMEMPVKISINNHLGVWIYGKYFVNVNLK